MLQQLFSKQNTPIFFSFFPVHPACTVFTFTYKDWNFSQKNKYRSIWQWPSRISNSTDQLVTVTVDGKQFTVLYDFCRCSSISILGPNKQIFSWPTNNVNAIIRKYRRHQLMYFQKLDWKRITSHIYRKY